MNADESQTPKPNEESLDEQEEQSFPFDFLADSDDDLEEEEIESQANSNSQQEAEVNFLQDIEAEISTVEQIEAPAENHRSELVVEQRLAHHHQLQTQEQTLKQEIARLQATHQQLSEQVAQTQTAMGRVVQEALAQLEQRKGALQIAIEQLEKRQERIRAEMRTTFAGTSQDLAIRVQGFKDYLTGSLQDLAAAAEQLELAPKAKPEPQPQQPPVRQPKQVEEAPSAPQFIEQRFQSTTKQIRRLLDRYRNKPDYYGPPWQLRRTFEPAQAERVADWFFKQGGRGALRTMGSRLQNILVSSAAISVLYELYGDRLRTLVLADSPERLGDWRRGLQDCLGISRSDFGPDRGLALFESAEAAAIKAERLIKANQMPLIIIDDSEDKISLSLLQFPLLLAFAPDPQTVVRRDEFDF